MPRTQAQNEWRKNHKAFFARVELTEHDKRDWQAYADSQNLPLSTMIRRCIARCMVEDGWKGTGLPENESEM